jgi:DNA-directed RNA polymerase sigma subunit (sigma70/sigma32)
MTPRQTSSDDRDDRQSAAMGKIKATLEMAARERTESRTVMDEIRRTLNSIENAITRLTTLQESGEKRLEKIEVSIGEGGLASKITKIEGIQMLDQSEMADLDKRTKALEDKAASLNRWALASMSSAILSLLLVIGTILKIIP